MKVNEHRSPLGRTRAGTRLLAPNPPLGSEFSQTHTTTLWSLHSPLCSPYPQLSLAMVLEEEPVAGTLDLWQGAGSKELGGPGWRAGPPAPQTRNPKPEGTVVTRRGRPSGEKGLCSAARKVSKGDFLTSGKSIPERHFWK